MTGLRERMKQGRPILTVFSIIPSTEIVEMIALAGFDAVILDTEHGPYGVESLSPLVVAARAGGIYSIVRVKENNASLIGSVLDAGADGVLVPQVTSPAEAEAAVAAARFAPLGTRGANPWVRAAGFNGDPNWFAAANEDVAVLIMIEGREGAAAASEIIGTPTLDGVFLGPVDMSHALGVPGQIDHPDVVRKIDDVVAEARRRNMAAAVFSPTPDGAQQWFSRGATMVALGVDAAHVLTAFKGATKAALSGPPAQ